jgi:glycosyltransferase involved in cell wall biosynthesis
VRILLCSQTALSRERGGSKVVIELAEELQRLGWSCELVSPDDVDPRHGARDVHRYAAALRDYLRTRAPAFDVVDYDHSHLPYPRRDFPSACLFVARAVLLAHHFERIAIPDLPGLKSRLRSLVMRRKEESDRRKRTLQAHQTVLEADLVNVANEDDKAELVRCGIAADKIVVIPYGIGRDRRALFEAIAGDAPPARLVGFVGTFDARKGATDMPAIVRAVCDAVPGARFRLVGVLTDPERVRRAMPRRLRARLDIVPSYAPDELPGLLAPCSVGIFPSYIEAFGFGVLETLAAGVPVVAYDTPGPPAMLPREWLVPRGDAAAMSARVIELLRDDERLRAARALARERSRPFDWSRIARLTAETYAQRWQARQA